MDQISKIVSILGSPGNTWPDAVKQAAKKGIGIPEYPEIALSTVIPNCPSDALAFITECLRWDPSKRITATQMINHPFFNKENISSKHHEMHVKKSISLDDKPSYKL
jgi:serine/threonine protein kinase